jgi:hypothetical protein
MRFFLLIPAAVASGLAIGCGDQQPAMAPADAVPTAALVERGTADIGLLIVDEDRGLTSVIGNSFPELAVLCAGGLAPAAHDALVIIPPTEAVKLLVKNPAAEVIVWQLVSGDLCGVLATTPPYAEGNARFGLVDNEASDFPVGPGGNAVTIHAEGGVTVAGSGEELRYGALVHIVLPPGATSLEESRLLRSEISMH